MKPSHFGPVYSDLGVCIKHFHLVCFSKLILIGILAPMENRLLKHDREGDKRNEEDDEKVFLCLEIKNNQIHLYCYAITVFLYDSVETENIPSMRH